MRIVKLSAENFKRLKAVEITPDGNTVVIAGKNAQGKTSVLDAIWHALGGKAATKGTTKPIRDGEAKAYVKLDLGDLVVTRRWSASGSTLTVESAAGAKYPSPQSVLDQLIGKLAFDPLDFANADARDQRKALLSVVELEVDPDAVAAQRKELYDERTAIGREVKRAKGHLDSLNEPPAGVPSEPIDPAISLQNYLELKEAYDRRQELLREHAEIAEEIKNLQRKQVIIIEQGKALKKVSADQLDEAKSRMESAAGLNKLVDAAKEYRSAEKAACSAQEEYDAHTSAIEALDTTLADALAKAKMPYDGLSFDDEGVLYQGVPFSQASGAERLRVSIAMAMAMNPEVRVIRITDGSLLDSDNLALIEEMAAEHDFQIWIERVDESGAVGVVIEDGAVKA